MPTPPERVFLWFLTCALLWFTFVDDGHFQLHEEFLMQPSYKHLALALTGQVTRAVYYRLLS